MLTTPLNLDNAKLIQGWMSDGELSFLAEQASKAQTILEIGSWQGRSTRALADNSSDNTLIVAVDPWNYKIGGGFKSDMETYSMFRRNLKKHLESEKVIPVQKLFKDYHSAIKFDFIFIDGDHFARQVKHDINKSLTLLNEGGIIAGHDYCDVWPDVKKVVDSIFPNVNLVESIWWTKKS